MTLCPSPHLASPADPLLLSPVSSRAPHRGLLASAFSLCLAFPLPLCSLSLSMSILATSLFHRLFSPTSPPRAASCPTASPPFLLPSEHLLCFSSSPPLPQHLCLYSSLLLHPVLLPATRRRPSPPALRFLARCSAQTPPLVPRQQTISKTISEILTRQ